MTNISCSISVRSSSKNTNFNCVTGSKPGIWHNETLNTSPPPSGLMVNCSQTRCRDTEARTRIYTRIFGTYVFGQRGEGAVHAGQRPQQCDGGGAEHQGRLDQFAQRRHECPDLQRHCFLQWILLVTGLRGVACDAPEKISSLRWKEREALPLRGSLTWTLGGRLAFLASEQPVDFVQHSVSLRQDQQLE